MIKIQFDLTKLMPCDALKDIAAAFSTTVDNDTITIPIIHGDGLIQKKDLAEGFCIFSFDICLHQSGEFTKKATVNGNKIFNLVYILTPDVFTLDEPTQEDEHSNPGKMQMLLDAVDRDLSFTFLRGQRIKLLVVSMDATWLKKEFEHTSVSFHCLLHNLVHEVQPAIHYRATNAEEYRTVKELHGHFKEGIKEPFFIKAKAMMLMSGFFNNLFIDCSREEVNMHLHHEKMNKVQQLLQDHVSDHLPSLKEIAREVMISESSLKRYFKTVYGTSIYDYYLQLKMEKAKQMLGNSKVPVKEVAYSLGYERTSSFIRTFKKFYHLSPGFFHKAHVG